MILVHDEKCMGYSASHWLENQRGLLEESLVSCWHSDYQRKKKDHGMHEIDKNQMKTILFMFCGWVKLGKLYSTAKFPLISFENWNDDSPSIIQVILTICWDNTYKGFATMTGIL